MSGNTATEPVADFVRALHECWPRGDLDALENFYHADVVLLPPDLGPPIRGRTAVVESYREFLGAAELERFELTAMDLFSFPTAAAGSTFMVHATFDIDYRLDGEDYREQGLEVYTIQDDGERLAIVWRQQIVLDSRVAAKAP